MKLHVDWDGALWLQPTLDGDTDLVREWGRLGRRNHPRRLVSSHSSPEAAVAAAVPVIERRVRRGYVPA